MGDVLIAEIGEMYNADPAESKNNILVPHLSREVENLEII
jgi:hypothetical protein